ncbi:hypothetical protein D3C72_825860 [compost metagenome]
MTCNNIPAFREANAQTLHQCDSIHKGHIHIDQQNINPIFLSKLQRFFSILCLTDHLHAQLLPIYRISYSFPYDRFIIGYQYPVQ